MTFDELNTFADELKKRLQTLKDFLNIDEKRREMAEIEAKMAAPDFWDRKEEAQNLMAA